MLSTCHPTDGGPPADHQTPAPADFHRNAVSGGGSGARRTHDMATLAPMTRTGLITGSRPDAAGDSGVQR